MTRFFSEYRQNERSNNNQLAKLNDLVTYIQRNHVQWQEYKEISNYNPDWHGSMHYSISRTEEKKEFYNKVKNARNTANTKLINLIEHTDNIGDLRNIIKTIFELETEYPLITFRMSKFKWEDRNLCLANDDCCAPITFLFCLPKNIIPSMRHSYKGERVSHMWNNIIKKVEKKIAFLENKQSKNKKNIIKTIFESETKFKY